MKTFKHEDIETKEYIGTPITFTQPTVSYFCSVCGKELGNCIPVCLTAGEGFREHDEFVRRFGSASLNICLCCLAKAVGVREIGISQVEV